MSLFESGFDRKEVSAARATDPGSEVKMSGEEAGERGPVRKPVLGVPIVQVEAPLNESGFRSGAPIRYGTDHVSPVKSDHNDTATVLGDGPGAVHLKLPPLDSSAESSDTVPRQSPEGSLGGSTTDLYISNHGHRPGSETPDELRARRRAHEMRSYSGEGSELQLPLPSARQSIHPIHRDA